MSVTLSQSAMKEIRTQNICDSMISPKSLQRSELESRYLLDLLVFNKGQYHYSMKKKKKKKLGEERVLFGGREIFQTCLVAHALGQV